jgi:hypothetical protein
VRSPISPAGSAIRAESADVGRDLPPTIELLTSGGDARTRLDAVNGANKYGCPPAPDPGVLAYGSSTASIISNAGFAAAELLRGRLRQAARARGPAAIYAAETTRLRAELLRLCAPDLPGVDVILGASGTDLHLFAAELAAASSSAGLLILAVESAETGSGVPAALAGRRPDAGEATDGCSSGPASAEAGNGTQVATIALRTADGCPRPKAAVDAEVEALATAAIASGRRVLLIVTDVSKTGLIGPSIGCARGLQARFPRAIDVLVDACQFRLAGPTLGAYLAAGFWVAVTGSKFVTGPAFSGALLIPPDAGSRLRELPLPADLGPCSVRADWALGWAARTTFEDLPGYGLLLRWEAALAELRVFAALPQNEVAAFLARFAQAVGRRLDEDPAFERLPVPALDRVALATHASWDHIQTIFPFLLRAPGARGRGTLLNRDAAAAVYRRLGADLGNRPEVGQDKTRRAIAARRCQIGQPVPCGTREGIQVAALRLCNSMRLVNDALSPQGRGASAVIADALAVLDKAALLVS